VAAQRMLARMVREAPRSTMTRRPPPGEAVSQRGLRCH
jgi:hypothetical protein